MNRNILTDADLNTDSEVLASVEACAAVKGIRATPNRTPLKPDDYSTRLLKYIPIEVITLYQTLDAVLRASAQNDAVLSWIVFVFGSVATWLHLSKFGRVQKPAQLAVSTGAFIVWAFSLGGPFRHYPWYNPLYGALLLPMYTFLVPLVAPAQGKAMAAGR